MYIDNDVALKHAHSLQDQTPDAGAKENILAAPNQLLTLKNCGEFVTFTSTVSGTFELEVASADTSYTSSDYYGTITW